MDKAQVAQELLLRRQARTDFLSFYRYCFPKFIEGKHFVTISELLEQVNAGTLTRLIISCPPQHGKSTLTSVYFPNYFLAHHPEARVVVSSYSQSMAEIQSRRAKDAFYSPEFHNLFPDVTPEINDKRFKASDKEYETRQRGSLYAVGIGGGLTGRGFELGIIDDYVANRMDANSPAISTQINDWWRSTFLTRQSPTARIIIIATRWTMNDLIGTVLKEESGKWKSVTLPAIQDGEALWPERYPLSKLEERRAEIGIHEWTALYQGAPVAHGGNRLKTDNIKIHDTLKDFPNIIYSRGWDLASTSKQRNSDNPDYTCGVLAAVNTRSNRPELWIKDCVLLREEAPRRNEIIQRTAITDGPTVHQFVESYGMQKDNFFILQSILTGNNIVKKSLLPGDKTVRAAALEPIFEAGNVHMLKANWNNEFLSQVSAFPDATVHDDVVDALSIIVGESTRAKAGILITS